MTYTDNMMMEGNDMYTFVIGVYEAGVFRDDRTNRLLKYETVRARTPKDALNLVKDMYTISITPVGNISYSILRSDYKEIA